jgi:hypothetical protein
MGEVEVGTRTDWAKNRRRSYQERNILTKNFGDGVEDNPFSKNNGNLVRYWGKPYDTIIPGMPTNTQLIV